MNSIGATERERRGGASAGFKLLQGQDDES
jgi:hypothetical protein